MTTKDIKVASQKKAVDTFMELYKSDPEGISTSIGKAYADLDYFHGISRIRDWNANRISKKFKSKGEDWIASKGYLLFNQSMTSEENQARTKYYKLLLAKGYDAISDINDIQTGYNSDDPIIFINSKNSLHNKKSVSLTSDEIELANARYNYDEASKHKITHLDDYVDAKRYLKKVEKKQGLRK